MDEEAHRAQNDRLRRYLRELQDRISPRSYDLLMEILQGVNASMARGGGSFEIEITEEDRELFISHDLQDELLSLLCMLSFREEYVVVDLDDAPHTKSIKAVMSFNRLDEVELIEEYRQEAAARAAQRESDRCEMAAIFRASGMEV